MLGIGVGFGGVILLAVESIGNFSSSLGIGLVVCAGLAWSVANMIMMRLRSSNTLSLIVWMSLVPPIPLFIASYMFEPHDQIYNALTTFDLTGLAALIYLAFCSTLLAYAAWAHLLSTNPAAAVAPYTFLVPVFGIISGTVILDENITIMMVFASALILIGLIVSSLGLGITRVINQHIGTIGKH